MSWAPALYASTPTDTLFKLTFLHQVPPQAPVAGMPQRLLGHLSLAGECSIRINGIEIGGVSRDDIVDQVSI